MIAGDTIVAVASPPGRSARAMIRISGAGTRGLVREVIRAGAVVKVDSNPCFPALLELSGGVSVQSVPVLVALFSGPRSYTGEDSAEIQLPGNPALVERVVSMLVSRVGVRQANPGEFTARAYLNGKLTLDQAEGVAATIAATSEEQLGAATLLLQGRTGAEYRRWADELTTLLALVESGIDFTDQEDVVPIAPAALAARVDALLKGISGQLGYQAGFEPSHAMPRVALVGRPNAGKSTLFNALLGRRRAVTSPQAGTTRDVLAEELELGRDVPGGPTVLIEDLAGLDAGVGAEGTARGRAVAPGEAQTAAKLAAETADVLVWCDPSGRFDSDPLDINNPHASVIRVRTFGDQPHAVGTQEDLAVCALDGWQLGTLRRAIADAATVSRAAGVAALLPRHRRAMTEAVVRLGEATASVTDESRLPNPEVTATALRGALDAMGELVGQISPDDVLGRVFATFCVGK